MKIKETDIILGSEVIFHENIYSVDGNETAHKIGHSNNRVEYRRTGVFGTKPSVFMCVGKEEEELIFRNDDLFNHECTIEIRKGFTWVAENIAEFRHNGHEEFVSCESESNGDKANHPNHYTWLKDKCGVEVIDLARHMDFNMGNVLKYVLRAGYKKEEGYSDSQKKLEDLREAAFYLNDEITMVCNETERAKHS